MPGCVGVNLTVPYGWRFNVTTLAHKPRLDKDARREAILDVAQDVFLEEGFAGASMSAIASRLGGSKGTLYNYFRSKEELFTAFVERRCYWHQAAMFGDVDETHAAPVALRSIAKAFLLATLSETSLRVLRLIIAEAERSPDIGRSFYENGPQRCMERLGRMMAAWAKDGQIRTDDPLGTAEFFLGVTKGRLHMSRLLNYRPELTEAEAEFEAERAVSVFLAAFGAR